MSERRSATRIRVKSWRKLRAPSWPDDDARLRSLSSIAGSGRIAGPGQSPRSFGWPWLIMALTAGHCLLLNVLVATDSMQDNLFSASIPIRYTSNSLAPLATGHWHQSGNVGKISTCAAAIAIPLEAAAERRKRRRQWLTRAGACSLLQLPPGRVESQRLTRRRRRRSRRLRQAPCPSLRRFLSG